MPIQPIRQWRAPSGTKRGQQRHMPFGLALKYVLVRLGGMAPQFSPLHDPFEATSVPHLVYFPSVWGPKDMLSSPLGPHILSYEPPHGFVMQPIAMCDGSTDPYDHMLHFNQTMILSAGNDHLLCKAFLTSLKGPALAWIHKLPRGSINSFNKLGTEFIFQYLCSVRQKGNISSL